MELSPLGDTVLSFLTPLTPYVRGIIPFDPLISACILGVLAFFLIKGHRRYELLRIETEALVKRYTIFRGRKQNLLYKVQADQDMREEILRSISRSWHKFKEYHGHKMAFLEGNYRWMKNGLLLGGILLILNTVRDGVAGLALSGRPSGFFFGLFQDLPYYLLVVVGIALLRIQREEVYGVPTNQKDPALETLFADFDQDDLSFSEEFDPLEGEKGEG